MIVKLLQRLRTLFVRPSEQSEARSYETLCCQAIAEQRLMEFVYDDERRWVLPLAHGKRVRTGRDTLRAFQIRSDSDPHPSGEPKTWVLAKMIDGTVTAESFDVPEAFHPGDEHLRIHCELSRAGVISAT